MDVRKRAGLKRLFEIGVAAADPFGAVSSALPEAAPTLVLAVGKAARRMAEAALARYGPVETLVATVAGADAPLPGAVVMIGDHPVPGAGSAAAGAEIWARAGALGAGDRLLVLMSGGASALVAAPAEGLSLDDKIAVTEALLASGAEIGEMNLVRQQLSRLKGGGLVTRAAPAAVEALILSDVIGDDLSAIGSGLTVPPLGTRAEARAMLERLGAWDGVPAAVRRHLSSADPRVALPEARNRIVGSNARSVAAMSEAAPEAATLEPVTGDVGLAATRVAGAAAPGLTLWGGETTVVLRGQGRGGRNQEMALRIALLAEERGWPEGWLCLCGGTDGRDGPTDAAGGLVDAGTLGRIRAAGLDPAGLLAENDSYRALAAAGDLLMTGATGTNVADLGMIWRP
ncbi:glycerate kinase type-2 family protein [Roseisalinus antarcticus]|uniref:Putative hydroxypyruvate reductase n=1 Tax=Roseisalinus antarcticus TaxID=254357 RepID=A0A1Y5TYK9_9RHOB|nr:DUF4147 domain-containing protein [Roseisalinus antarcticus]SLN76629.1 Putative hydroxypyruvate reductase [Roseisalinus antarcticus]